MHQSATAHSGNCTYWLSGIAAKLFLSVFLLVSTVMPSWSVEQCNRVPNGYSVAKAVGFMRLAYDAIERCRAAPKAVSGVPCREAYWHLTSADINLAQVWAQTADSRNNCWICKNTYLVSQARDLAKLVIRFNQIVRADGRYWASGANKTIEGLNTGWAGAPLCRNAGPTAPWVDGNPPVYDPNAVVIGNNRCSVRYTSHTGRAPQQSDFSSNKCYLLYRAHNNGFTDYLVYLSPGGYAPSSYPSGFVKSHGNTCRQVLDQVNRNCGL